MITDTTLHIGLTIARTHGVLAYRPGSPVFHVANGNDLTPSGLRIRRAAGAACGTRTRQLLVIGRTGVTVAIDGRRMCGRCEARLSASARRASQPVSRAACVEFYAGLTLADLVVATALAASVDETHRIAFAMGLRFPVPTLRRPTNPVDDRGRFMQALYDVNAELLRRRRVLRNAERAPEEIEAAAAAREAEEFRNTQIAQARKQAVQIDRAVDRRNRGQWLTPYERGLVDSA